MKKAALKPLLILLLAGSASAGETGTINQAGPYETTMKFYLHPAHGFPGTAETARGTVGPVGENATTSQSGKPATQSGKMAAHSGKAATQSAKTATQPGTIVATRSRHQPVKTRASADLQFDP